MRTREDIEAEAERICNAITEKYTEIDQLLLELQELEFSVRIEPTIAVTDEPA